MFVSPFVTIFSQLKALVRKLGAKGRILAGKTLRGHQAWRFDIIRFGEIKQYIHIFNI